MGGYGVVGCVGCVVCRVWVGVVGVWSVGIGCGSTLGCGMGKCGVWEVVRLG